MKGELSNVELTVTYLNNFLNNIESDEPCHWSKMTVAVVETLPLRCTLHPLLSSIQCERM